MKIGILYRTHPISVNAIPSVARFFGVLVDMLAKKDPELKFHIATPGISSIQGAEIYSLGLSYVNSSIYTFQRRINRLLGFSPPKGRVNISKVKNFLKKTGSLDVIICTKISDILLLKKLNPNQKIIWWHLGLEHFDRRQFIRAINSCDLIVYTGNVVYNFVYEKVMPNPFPTPILVARGPYDIELLEMSARNADRTKARIELEIDKDEIIFLHVGGNRPEKGLKILEAALVSLKLNGNFRLISVGHKKRMQRRRGNNMIIEYREIVPVSQLYKYYIATDIGLACPVWIEPGPAAFLEMLYFAMPVIASANAGILEMVGDSNCCILIQNPNNIEEWSNGFSLLVNQKELRKDLSISGRKRALEILNEPVIEKWEGALKLFKN